MDFHDEYKQEQLSEGFDITCGMDMWEEYGNTWYPFMGLHLLNMPGLSLFQDYIEKQHIPKPGYNANIRTARWATFATLIHNIFESSSEMLFERYDHTWREYRENYNPSMPELADIWCGPTTEEINEIVPQFVNRIDPISMKWIDPDYPKLENGEYHLKEPIKAADPRFLYKDTKMKYINFEPYEMPEHDTYYDIEETLNSNSSIPDSVLCLNALYEQILYHPQKKDEDFNETIRIIKAEHRHHWRNLKKRKRYNVPTHLRQS